MPLQAQRGREPGRGHRLDIVNIFETVEEAATILKPGMVVRLRPHPGTQDVWIRMTYPASFSTTMGRPTAHIRGVRLMAKGVKPHPVQKRVTVVLLSQIRGLEAR
jgi:hypothetical protein